jgi:putative transposase
MLPGIKRLCRRLVKLWAHSNYGGTLVEWVAGRFGCVLEIVKPLADQKGFVVQPKRWIVERTLAWLGKCRRLSKDYECNPKSSEAWIDLAMIGLMVRRLAPF